mmetsp:Transcript_5918/g.5181  ORF Transcript_5918/g.5181 Transcript_5918/m.5181 type:complete len:134 (+) Transcript_5918:955-1356(+)
MIQSGIPKANSYAKDYLNLLAKPKIQKILKDNGENVSSECVFSDYIYRINSRQNREYRIAFITTDYFYCLHPKKSYRIERKIDIEKIYKVTISKSSAGLLALHVNSEYDYLIDSYKRLDMILFLRECFNKMPI